MAQFNDEIQSNLALVTAVLGLVSLLLLVAVVVEAHRLGGLKRRLDGLTRGARGDSLEAVLDTHLDTVERVSRDLDELSHRTAALEVDARLALQKLGLVRFNPFEDTGGNQSFALAVLDANDDGFVMSSLHARSGTRMYGKQVSHGQTEGALSVEEAQALDLAIRRQAGAPATPGRRLAARQTALVGRVAAAGPVAAPVPVAAAGPAATAGPTASRGPVTPTGRPSHVPLPDGAGRDEAGPAPLDQATLERRLRGAEPEVPMRLPWEDSARS